MTDFKCRSVEGSRHLTPTVWCIDVSTVKRSRSTKAGQELVMEIEQYRLTHCTKLACSVITILVIDTTTFIFMVLSSWYGHYKIWRGLFDEWRTAPGSCWPLDQANWLEPQAWICSYNIHIQHCHLLLLILKTNSFYYSIKGRGWVDQDGLPAHRWWHFTVLTRPEKE